MMNLRQIEVFHAIMVTGSVTGAARLLNVTQPAVTAVLKHCESSQRLKLFVRTGGRLKPTREAEALFPDIAAVFGRLAAAGRLMEDLAGGRLGSLSIAAAFPIANGPLTEAVARFVVDRPEVRCTLQSLTSPQVLDRVINREVEIGIVHIPVVHGAVETEMLANWRIGCAMAPDHPLAQKDQVEIEDLADVRIITYLPQIVFRPYIDRALSDAGIVPKIAIQVSIALTGMMLARHGAGVALVDTALIDAIPIPNLTVRPLVPRIEAKTLVLWPKFAPRSLIAVAFMDHLKRQMAA